jgi:hypothetical protein
MVLSKDNAQLYITQYINKLIKVPRVGRDDNCVFCSDYHVLTLFRNLQKLFIFIYIISIQGTWHSPNMSPTLVHSQAFHIIIWQPPIEKTLPYPPSMKHTEQLCGFEPWEPSTQQNNNWLNFQRRCWDIYKCRGFMGS